MKLIKLIESQNRCLLRFLDESVQFLTSAEAGNLSNLDILHNSRETSLKAFKLFENKINEEIPKLKQTDKSETLLSTLRKYQQTREEIISSILKIDNKIINCIESEKLRLQKELQLSNRNTEVVRKFKSNWVIEPGENLDGKL